MKPVGVAPELRLIFTPADFKTFQIIEYDLISDNIGYWSAFGWL